LPKGGAARSQVSSTASPTRFSTGHGRKLDLAGFALIKVDARKERSEFESLGDMEQSSAEVLAEFPERGLHWAKEQFETVLSETENYVREKPTESLLCALAVGYILNRLPVGRILGGLFRLVIVALKPAILIYGATKLFQAVQEEES
jgi:ElaB/YqjD/DUF883 family membrane-anchored ribosome-binding protein